MKNKGAITVFLLLITTVMFCFMGFLIDGSRIILASYMVDNASVTALRSTMGHYDKNLVSEYGLYAIQDTKEAKISEIYKKYFTANLIGNSTNMSMGEYRPISMMSFESEDIVKCDVTPSDELIRSDVFKRQIEEYMKIRGPVSAVMEILNTLSDKLGKKADKALNEANKAEIEKSKGEEAKNDVKTLNEKITDFNKNISTKITPKKTSSYDWCTEVEISEEADGQLRFDTIQQNVSKSIMDELKSVETSIIKSGSKSVGNLIWGKTSSVIDSNYSISNEIDAIKSSLEEAKNSAGDYASNMGDEVVTIDNDGTDINKYVDTNYTKPTEILHSVSSTETQINTVIADLEKKVSTYEEAAQQQQIIDALCKLSLYKQTHWDDYSDEDFKNDYNYIIGKSSNSSFKSSLPSVSELKTLSLRRINQLRSNAAAKVNNSIDAISGVNLSTLPEVKLPSDSNKCEDEKEQEKGNVLSKIAELKVSLEEIQSKERSGGQKRGLFSSIAPYKIDSSVYNKLSTDTDSVDLGFIKKLLNFFKSLLDDTALTSYVMDKCTYLTSAAGRDHYFQYGEAEYIIFGSDNQFLNIVESVTSVWVIRIGIDSVYYFVNSAVAPISVRAVYALTRGAIQGSIDMVELIGTDSGCELLPNLDFRVKYDEMCFVAILFKSFIGGYDSVANPLKDTMQATLQYKDQNMGNQAVGTDLTKMYTTLQADVKVKVDLVFLPIMGFGLIGNEYFDDGRFTVKKSVIATY